MCSACECIRSNNNVFNTLKRDLRQIFLMSSADEIGAILIIIH